MEQNTQRNLDTIVQLLQQDTVDWSALLAEVMSGFACTTGTIHFLDLETSLLQLQTHIGIPDFLISKLTTIPIGKGMAGIAAERREPVEMCNLQTDTSGVARPSAKKTKVAGSIAVPVIYNKILYGVVGVAKTIPYDFTNKEQTDLLQIGEVIGQYLNQQ